MADKLKGNRDKVFWRDLGRYKNKKARKIYILQELIRQYNSSLYERIALSKNKKAVMQLGKKSQIIEGPTDAIKDHTVLEFLDLREDESYTESGLENAIISKLEHFMIELGKGFLFEGRQKRFTVEGDNFYVDLVFYNRLIRSFVLVDIRIGSLTHQDIGQMQMYVNYYDRKIKLPNKNSTIGIILCKEENKTVVEFTLEFMRSSRQLPKQKKLLR
ncbi:MAG: PDDEXK nuclease domain-containing protein [Ferruginibacter sp.]